MPKLFHGWREFAKEIIIIVIGVLIALGFEQAVEYFHWQHKVAEGEERLRSEVGLAYTFAAEDIAAKPCVLAQIGALREALARSGPELKPVPRYSEGRRDFVLSVPDRFAVTAVWEGLAGDGTAAHMDKTLQGQLGTVYTQLALINQEKAASLANTYGLLVLSHPMPLDPATRGALIRALGEEEGRAEILTRQSSFIMARLAQLGLQPADAKVDAALDELNARSGTLAFCREHRLPIADWKAVRSLAPGQMLKTSL
jgi:hypothetical protein